MTIGRSPLLLVTLLLMPCSEAITQGKLDFSIPDLLNLKQDTKSLTRTQVETRAIPMDAPLDASEYTVGPGDLLSLNIWSTSPAEYQLSVTPEGFLLIPNVGTISVRELTLDQARDKVIPLARKKYPGAEITLTLVNPRKVSVQIAGQVMNEGMLEASSVQRVDDLMSLANTLPPTQTTRDFYFYDIPKLKRDASQRNISIHRRDGTVRRVDLIRYAISGNSQYNPYLREGDMVYVPLRKPSENNIGALGGFIGPTNVEYAEGDSVTDLVAIGYGLKPLADAEHAILARESPGGGMDTVQFDLKAILEHRAPNLALRPGDRLFVPATPDMRAGEYVILEGEVMRPGRYPITSSGTYLRDVIRAAGGFTPIANPVAATLIRGRASMVNIPEEILEEQLRSMRTTFTVPQDSIYYITETALRLRGEAVSVNFHKLFVDNDTTYDVTLRNYDRLTIPPKLRSVYVFGQVLQPGYVPFVQGKGYRYYIEMANGYTNDARTGDVRVIKAGSKIWLDPGETDVEDGDAIWVPKDYHYPFAYYLSTTAQIASILGTVATLYILARTVK